MTKCRLEHLFALSYLIAAPVVAQSWPSTNAPIAASHALSPAGAEGAPQQANLRDTAAIEALSTTTLDFDSVATSSAPYFVTANPYLSNNGISVSSITSGTHLVIGNDLYYYNDAAVRAPSPPNTLTQVGSNAPIQFTLTFATPLNGFSFERSALIAATSSGVSHPYWSATAFNSAGVQIGSSVGEDSFGSFSNVPAASFSLTGPDIAAVRFNSENRGTGFNAVVLDDFVLSYPTPTLTSFTATPTTITAGQSSTLTWTTMNTTSVTISGVAGTQAASGSASVTPASTTTYTLTATGPGGMATATATVTVGSLATCLHNDWNDLRLPTSPIGMQLEWYSGYVPPADRTLFPPMIDEALNDRVRILTAQLAQQGISLNRLSGYRPQDYQTHLYRLSVLFARIYSAEQTEPNVAVTCDSAIQRVLSEVSAHHLSHKTNNGVPIPGQLLVGMTSRHSDLPAKGLDVSLDPASGLIALKAALGRNLGLYAPCQEKSVHLQTALNCSGSTTVTAVAYVPAGTGVLTASSGPLVPLRLLLRSPSGRRVGYDSTTGTVINEIGETASYSGIDSDPQVVTVDDALDGAYSVETVAVSSGDYTLALTADNTEDGSNIASSSRTGHAVTGDHPEPLALNLQNTVPQAPAHPRVVSH